MISSIINKILILIIYLLAVVFIILTCLYFIQDKSYYICSNTAINDTFSNTGYNCSIIEQYNNSNILIADTIVGIVLVIFICIYICFCCISNTICCCCNNI